MKFKFMAVIVYTILLTCHKKMPIMGRTQLRSGMMKTATMKELGLLNVPFPDWFKPKYMTIDEDNCMFVFDSMPEFDGCMWESDGSSYEIGVDDTEDRAFTPEILACEHPSESIVEIIGLQGSV